MKYHSQSLQIAGLSVVTRDNALLISVFLFFYFLSPLQSCFYPPHIPVQWPQSKDSLRDRGKMQEYRAEKYLAKLYPCVVVLSIITSITYAIAFNHWKGVLDRCEYNPYYENCVNCIFYARTTPSQFVGSNSTLCYWSFYGPILVAILGTILGSYHVYRRCMKKGTPRGVTTAVKQR